MWSEKTKRQKSVYLDVAQALYSTNPTVVQAIPVKRPKAKRSANDPSEATIQATIVQWARSMAFPLISIPNAGKRSAWAGHREVALGLTRGVSDLFLARPSRQYHGMWIELKSRGRQPTVEQHEWLARMIKEGYHAVWFDNIDDTKRSIIDYLGI